MKRMIFHFVLILSLLSPVSAFAFADALSSIELKQIALDIKAQLLKTIELVKQATVQSKTMLEMRELAINMKDNYDFVRNFDLERFMGDVVDEIEGITLLDNMKGKDFDQQFDLLMREIDHRFTDEEEKDNVKYFMEDLRKLYALQEMKAAESEAITSGKLNYANNVATTASNSGLSLIMQSKQEQREVINDAQERYARDYYMGTVNNAIQSMDDIK